MAASQSASSEVNTSRTITTFGSIFLFINNTVGPGMVVLPALMQQSGWLPTASCIILLCIMAYFIGIMLTHSIHKIPHNKNDHLKIEYLDLIKYYMGFTDTGEYIKKGDILYIFMRFCQCMYLLFMMAFLMGSLIQTCQTFDLAIARIFGQSYGIIYYPVTSIGIEKGNCIDSISSFCDNGTYVLSIGTIIIYLLIIPFCLKDLQEAIWIQYIGSYGTIILMILWGFMLTFSKEFDENNVPVATPSIYSILGFNFYNVAFLCTYPSWMNEKKEYVAPTKVLKYIAVGTAFCFIFIGYMGGIAFHPYYMTSGDMLSKLNHFEPRESITNPTLISFFQYFGPISSYCYPILQSASGIPVFATVIRYNLINTNILNKKWSANIFAIVIPFVVSMILSHGNGFSSLLNWSGVILSSFINFILPIFFYYKSLLMNPFTWSQIAETPHHKSLLMRSNIDLEQLAEIENENHKISKSTSIESDILLATTPKMYDEEMGIQFVNTIFGNTRSMRSYKGCSRQSALGFLIFTVCLAFLAFILDIVAAI